VSSQTVPQTAYCHQLGDEFPIIF